MKPPNDHPIRILTSERSIVALELLEHDQPVTLVELQECIQNLRPSDLIEHLRVLSAAGIVTEPVPRRYRITPTGAKLLELQARIERVTKHPHL